MGIIGECSPSSLVLPSSSEPHTSSLLPSGYFDLDPSRTLDVIFDALTSSLLTHHRFFIDLLRCSAWSSPPSSEPVNSHEMDLSGESGSSVAAQVLGFKFKHYQDQTVMRKGEEAPKEMVLMAAILVREGLVKLKELWEHVSLRRFAARVEEEKS